jgi:hypothetical protein
MTNLQRFNLRQLWRDKRGVTLALVAASMSALIGFAGLGAETGLWYAIKRQNQSAADAGAISAAYDIIYDLANGVTPTSANLTPVASQAAAQNSYTGATPVVTYPYSDAIVASGVAVTLQTTEAASLASLFLPSVAIATKAVARVVVLDSPCILALNQTASDAINLQGSVTVNAPTCSAVADSNSSSAIHIQGSASITTATLVTPGNISYTGGAFTLNSTPLVGSAASFVPDPFATTPSHATLISGMPPTTPACMGTGTNPINYNGTCSVNGPSLPNNDLNLSASTLITGTLSIHNQTVNLAPGTYWITDGNLDIQSNGHLTCTACTSTAGVTIILTTTNTTNGKIGTVSMNSNSSMTLNASSTGTFAGMLIMQDKASNIGAGVTYLSSSASFQGGPSGSISGLLYLPHEAVTMQGNPNSTCALIIADTVIMQGNPTFTLAGCPTALTNSITVKTAVLAE